MKALREHLDDLLMAVGLAAISIALATGLAIWVGVLFAGAALVAVGYLVGLALTERK